MSAMAPPTTVVNVIVGVDTHKHVHVAVAVDATGLRLSDHRIPVDTVGYQDLERWATSLGRVMSFGIEGTGSYGAGLTSFLRRQGHRVTEGNRSDRRARRANGKSDTLDAELAACSPAPHRRSQRVQTAWWRVEGGDDPPDQRGS